MVDVPPAAAQDLRAEQIGKGAPRPALAPATSAFAQGNGCLLRNRKVAFSQGTRKGVKCEGMPLCKGQARSSLSGPCRNLKMREVRALAAKQSASAYRWNFIDFVND
eukprot:1140281-Pelagomonas_calceolata.AAC.6